MATKEEILVKLDTLKTNIDNIPKDAFKIPMIASVLKKKLRKRVENVKNLVENGSPNALNGAIFILTRKIHRPLAYSKRGSWVKQHLPDILTLIDEIIDDIELLFTNTPPVAMMKIDGTDIGQYFTAPVNVELNFDGSASWDEDGEIVSWSWGFGDGTPVENVVATRHTFTMMGTYRVVLTVTDDGTPIESGTDWCEITVM